MIRLKTFNLRLRTAKGYQDLIPGVNYDEQTSFLRGVLHHKVTKGNHSYYSMTSFSGYPLPYEAVCDNTVEGLWFTFKPLIPQAQSTTEKLVSHYV